MRRIVRKINNPVENFVNSKEFEELLKRKDYKIIALKNNLLSQKYFKDNDDSKYLIFNSRYGIEKAYYSNTLFNENLIDEIIVIQ